MWGQKNVGVKMWGVKLFEGAKTECSVCDMGNQGPPLGYTIFQECSIISEIYLKFHAAMHKICALLKP